MKQYLRLAVFLTIALLSACSIPVRSPWSCPDPQWGLGDPTSPEDLVLWSAIAWAWSDDKLATVPCGSKANCAAVADRIRVLGGEIVATHAAKCSIAWSPEG